MLSGNNLLGVFVQLVVLELKSELSLSELEVGGDESVSFGFDALLILILALVLLVLLGLLVLLS